MIDIGKWYNDQDFYAMIMKIDFPFSHCVRYVIGIEGIEYGMLETSKIGDMSKVPFREIDRDRLYEFFKLIFKGTRFDILSMFRHLK